MTSLLLDAGAEVAAADKDGAQAVHHAAGAGHDGAVARLCAAGAKLDAASGAGTPLHWAAGAGRAVVVAQVRTDPPPPPPRFLSSLARR